VLVEIAQHVVTGEASHRRLRAPDVATEWMIRPADLFEQAMDMLLRTVLVHPQFLEDDEALLLHLARIEQGRKQHVAQHVDGECRLVLRHPGPVHGQFLVSGGIEHAAHALDRFGNFFGAAVPS